jgi:hypothetical protein
MNRPPKKLTNPMKVQAVLTNPVVVLGPRAAYDGEYKELREEVWIPYDEKTGWLEKNAEVTRYTHKRHSDYDKACEEMKEKHLDLLFKYVNELPPSSFVRPAKTFYQGKLETVELSREDLRGSGDLSIEGQAWRDFAMRLAEATFPGLRLPELEMSAGNQQKAVLLAVARLHAKAAPVKVTDREVWKDLQRSLGKSMSRNTLNEAKKTYNVPRGPEWWKWVVKNIRDDDAADS